MILCFRYGFAQIMKIVIEIRGTPPFTDQRGDIVLMQQLTSRQIHNYKFELAETCTTFVDTLLHQPHLKCNNNNINMVKMIISLIT